MSAGFYSIADSVTMLQRILVHLRRSPATIFLANLGGPVVMLLVVYNVMAGVWDAGSSGISYINYLTPGIILITAIYGTATAATRVNADMMQGIIARFRSMSISRGSVLSGHVIGSIIGTLISMAVMFGLCFLTGFRPAATAVEWLAASGLIILYVTTIMWLAVAVGVASKSPEAVQSTMFLFYIIPFFSSAFVTTNDMSPVVAWIAENQPFSTIIETLRALLMGNPTGIRGLIAVAWSIGFALIGYLWSRAAYDRSTNQ